jgi:DUF1680 family protein
MEQYYNYNGKLKVGDKIFTPLHGVKLNAGLFREVFENNTGYLNSIDMGRMLYWFHKKTGIKTDAKPFTGHFEDNLKGQTAFLFLMGAGNALRWKENETLQKKVNLILDQVEQTAEPDGFMLPIDKSDFPSKEYPNYMRIWLNYGLTAAGLSCGERGFKMLRRWQDWFNECPELPIVRYLNLGYQGMVASTSVYTTPAGKIDDIEVARKYYEEDWRLGQFINNEQNAVETRKQPGNEPHPHGTEIESFEGYLDLYRATGAYYYLNAVLNFYNLYKKSWQHPGGGIVMCEFQDSYPGCNWITSKKPYNELCCSAFWIFLNQRLHRLFPDREEYVAEIEKSLYNIAFANQEGTEGIRYFANLEEKKDPICQVTCCCGSGTKIFGSLPEYLYSVSPDSIYVDIYTASEIEWETQKQTVILTTETKMPCDGNVAITLNMVSSQTFDLNLRIPCWAGDTEVFLNEKAVAKGHAGSYVKLDRLWSDGDRLTFTLKMSFRVQKYSGVDMIPGYDRYSVEYGPMLYAVVGKPDYNTTMILNCDIEHFSQCVRPSGKPLCFGFPGNPEYSLVPYFDIGVDEEFSCFPVFKTVS